MRSFGFSALTCLISSMPLRPGIDRSSTSTSKSVSRTQAHHLGAVGRLADDLEVRGVADDALEPFAHDRVVVGDRRSRIIERLRPATGMRASTVVPAPGWL